MANADAASTPLLGRKALVLGAGTAAGRRIAVALAEAGADVAVASASLDGDEVMACRRTRRAVEALGRRSVEYAFDVTLGQNVQVSTRQVTKEMGGLDILVWAVRVPSEKKATDKITDAEWTRALSVNLSGAFFACRAALREMLAAGGGRIVLVVGDSAFRDAQEFDTAMTTAEFGLSGLKLVLSREFEGRAITANLIVHGSPAESATVNGLAEAITQSGAAPPPSELGALAVYLASGDANGETYLAGLEA